MTYSSEVENHSGSWDAHLKLQGISEISTKAQKYIFKISKEMLLEKEYTCVYIAKKITLSGFQGAPLKPRVFQLLEHMFVVQKLKNTAAVCGSELLLLRLFKKAIIPFHLIFQCWCNSGRPYWFDLHLE